DLRAGRRGGLAGAEVAAGDIEVAPGAMKDVGAHEAAGVELHAVAGGDLVHVRRLQRSVDLFGEAGDGQRVDQRVVAGEAVGVEPGEGRPDDLFGRHRSADDFAACVEGIDLRAEVLELIGGVAAAGGGGVGRPLVDLGDV